MNEVYANPGEEEDTEGGFLNYLPAILWQRRWLIIVPTVVLSLAGLIAAFVMPTVYRSSATLLVESQELPPSLVGSPVTALIDQRIAKIRQQVLSRGDLIGLIQRLDLYEEERQTEPLSAIVQKVRENTQVQAVSADIGQQQGSTNTIAFQMSFDYEEPAKTQLVMQSFVERFLELDASELAEQADTTVDFLSQQAGNLQRQIVDIEGRITQIKASNGAVLMSSGMPTVANPGSFDAQIAALQRENELLAQQTRSQQEAPNASVQEAEENLAAQRAIYADDHPDVRAAERQLAAAKQVAKQAPPDPNQEMARLRIAGNNAQIAALGRARSAEMARSTTVSTAQARAPVLMEQIGQLDARATALRSQYAEVAQRLREARSSARMEEEQKGERLAVTDPPVVPDEPLSPDRPKLILGGIAAGLLVGFGLAFLVELLLRPIRGVGPIEKMLGVAPLVVIPTLRNKPTLGERILSFFSRIGSKFSFRRRAQASG